jgi:predicted secreted protein
MACYLGKTGVIKVGASAVGEVTNFSIEETAETVECTAMGDSYREYVVNFKNWTASVEVHWDPDDAGQTAFTVGDTISLLVYPEGEATGDVEYGGQAIVTGFNRTGTFDGLVEASITLQGTGALTTGAVA